jgi:hypothetical protein
MKQNLQKPSHFIWKAIILLGLLLLAFGLAMPALADYLGPDRTRTVTEIVRTGTVEGQTCMFSGGDWRYVVTAIYQCNDPSQPWLTEYPDYYALCDSSHDGTRVWHEECTDTVVTRVVTSPPGQACPYPGMSRLQATTFCCWRGHATELLSPAPVRLAACRCSKARTISLFGHSPRGGILPWWAAPAEKWTRSRRSSAAA